MGVTIVTVVAFLAALEHHVGTVNPGLVGLSISYALSVTGLLQGLVTAFTETEKEMVAVERLQEYAVVESEFSTPGTGALLPLHSSWPAAGAVEFRSVRLVYASRQTPSLWDVNFCIRPGEHVGIVGRTGAGKSSLFQVLFRMVELMGGQILVDGVDIARVSKRELRRRFAVIPQEAVLFQGSIRDNLDPFREYSDARVWSALERCALSELVHLLPGGLDHAVQEGGCNLSLGQRQLLCLGRALLKQSQVLCIDEATASVDSITGRHIQQTIAREFAVSTVLIVAHRIATVLQMDRILVLDGGTVIEQGTPAVLMADKTSAFSQLAAAAYA